MRGLWQYVLVVGLVAISTACASDDDEPETRDASEEAGERDARDPGEEAPGDLSGELLSVDDLDGGWDTAGPEEIDVTEVDNEVTGPCPDGEAVSLPNVERNLGARGNATVVFEATDGTSMLLIEELSHDPAGELFDALQQAFDACVDEQWEQTGRDGMETVRFEAMDPLADDAASYRLLWGSNYDRRDLFAMTHVDDVSLSLYLNGDFTDRPSDAFREAFVAAVANLKPRVDP